jgi:hypothetical protein
MNGGEQGKCVVHCVGGRRESGKADEGAGA